MELQYFNKSNEKKHNEKRIVFHAQENGAKKWANAKHLNQK